MSTYNPVFGIDGPITVSGVPLQYISGPSLTISYETEELDMVATGMTKAYINGKLDLGVTFTMKNFEGEGGSKPADVAAIRTAFATGSSISVSITDSAMGTISGDFIVTKMDETRQNGKVVSWNVELKPTFTGTALTFSLRP